MLTFIYKNAICVNLVEKYLSANAPNSTTPVPPARGMTGARGHFSHAIRSYAIELCLNDSHTIFSYPIH